MEYLIEFGLFTGKALILVISIITVLLTIMGLALRSKQQNSQKIQIDSLNKQYSKYKQDIESYVLDKKELKLASKKDKESKKENSPKKDIYVINFEGSKMANEVKEFRKEISAVLQVAKKGEEIIVNVESPGGAVHSYGLAASQLLRIKNHGCKLTICVDKVAASGGYMMACTADKLMAAPFAVIGSIGVVAQVPNFHKLLKKNDVDYEEFTSGDYKRTVSLLAENTEKGKKKFTEQIVDTHELFKDFVKTHRPQLNIEDVATGEYWFGQRALDKKLVDEIMTSDEYIMNQTKNFNVYKVSMKAKKKWSEKLSESMSLGIQKAFESSLNKWNFLN